MRSEDRKRRGNRFSAKPQNRKLQKGRAGRIFAQTAGNSVVGATMKIAAVCFDEELSRVDGLAKEMNRSRNWVIQEAVGRFLDYEAWFVEQVHVGQKAVEEGRAVPQDELMAEIDEKIAQA